MNTITTGLAISEAAEASGVSAHTLRNYEQAGLMRPVEREGNGHRLHSDDDLSWIEVLTKLHRTGMPIPDDAPVCRGPARGRRTLRRERDGDDRRRMIIDLSHEIADGTITYPGLPGPMISDHLSRVASRERYADGYEFQIGRIDMVSNTGTYLDTPFHRFPDGHDLAGLDLERVVNAPGVLVDATAVQQAGASLLDGVDVEGRAVLFHTGWASRWGTDGYGERNHPFVGVNAATVLVERGAAVVGIDSVNIDSTVGGERPIHTILLGAGIPIVEHLCRLDEVAGRVFRFTAAPPAVRGMGTFPVRAYAVTE